MIDLHVHSTASDGSLSPAQVVELAQAKGISYLALADHNTTTGLPEFLTAAKGTALRPVPSVEVSCELEGMELHVLAMNLPEQAFPEIQAVMTDMVKRAEERRRDLVDNLRRAGYSIYYEDIEKANPGSMINRAHIAVALKEAGYVPSVQAAIQTLLDESAGYYHRAQRLQAAWVLHMIQDLGAVSVWAHPFLKLDTKGVRHVLECLAPEGLVGMEALYSTYSPEQTQAALELAQHFKRKLSGGSDFHGTVKPDIQIGIGRGNLNIPEWIAEELLGF